MQIRTIGAFEARRHFGKLLSLVGFGGETVVVEKNGERVAALVPIQILESWEKERQAFFDEMHRIAETANIPEEEALRIASDAVAEVRAEKRKRQYQVSSDS